MKRSGYPCSDQVYVNDIDKEGNPVKKMVETSVGRLMVNEFVPEEVGYINEVLGKKLSVISSVR